MRVRVSKWTIGVAAAGVVSLAAVGAAGLAFAATSSGSGQSGGPAAQVTAFLDDVAQHLGVQPSALQSAIQQAEIDRVHQMQSSGKITAQQASTMISNIQSGKSGMFPGFGFGPGGRRGPHGGPGGPMGGPGGSLSEAATYLGITPQQLGSDLQSGKTLAQIADSTSGKSSQGLAAALTADMKSRLDQAVKAGRITSAQEQSQLSSFQTNLQNMLTHTFPAPGMAGGQGGPRGGHFGGGWWGGPMPAGPGGSWSGSSSSGSGSSSTSSQAPSA